MKFVLISNNLTSVKNFRTDLLLEIAKKGYQIYILAPDLASFSAEKEFLEANRFIIKEISLSRTGTNPISDSITLFNTYKVLKSIKPDVILSYTIKPVIYGTLAGYLARVPKIFALISGLGFAFQEHPRNRKSNFLKKIINTLYKYALTCSTKVFFQNSDDLSLLKNLGVLKSKIPSVVVNGSGVNTNVYTQVPLQLNASGSYKVNFIMVARLLHDKGIREYVEAARIVKKKYPEVDFNLVGGLDENPASISQQELDRIVATDTIDYLGKLTDVRPAIAKSNIFVLPSYREGIPRSVLEAMSMGRAIITTDAPGCKETVEHGTNGFKVKVQSVEELVEKMIIFIENNNLIGSMGEQSRRLAIEKYDVRIVNAQMISEMKL